MQRYLLPVDSETNEENDLNRSGSDNESFGKQEESAGIEDENSQL